jgi:hypothetical protein
LEHLKGVIDSGLRDGEGECTEGGALVDYGSLMGSGKVRFLREYKREEEAEFGNEEHLGCGCLLGIELDGSRQVY